MSCPLKSCPFYSPDFQYCCILLDSISEYIPKLLNVKSATLTLGSRLQGMIYVAEKKHEYAEPKKGKRRLKAWARFLIQCFWIDLQGQLPRVTHELVVDVVRFDEKHSKIFVKDMRCSIRAAALSKVVIT